LGQGLILIYRIVPKFTHSPYDFAIGIRGHWGVENRLHWVKNVVFNEDQAQMVDGYASAKLIGSS
jgi:predicted transposase YbfD/YdcC